MSIPTKLSQPIDDCRDSLGCHMVPALRLYLRGQGVDTIHDLASLSKKAFLQIPRCGKLRFNEARRFMIDNGYDWPNCSQEIRQQQRRRGGEGLPADAMTEITSAIELIATVLAELATTLKEGK